MPKITQWIALALTLAVAQASLAEDPGPPRGECHKLTNQIARYEGDLERAKQRKNALWEQANERQIDHLNQRLALRCPEHVPPTLAQRVGAGLDALGRGAIRLLPLFY